MFRRSWKFAAALLLPVVGLAAASVQAQSLSYVPEIFGQRGAYLLESQGAQRARVVNLVGAAAGTVATSGAQRLVTLDTPIGYQSFGPVDRCGITPLQQIDTLQVLFRQTSGSPTLGRSAIVELGTITTLTGCDAGQVTPFGSLSDPGSAVLHRSMSSRPSMSDLKPGSFLAGMREAPVPAGDPLAELPADVVQFLTGSQLRFITTGTVAPGAVDGNGWLVLSLPAFQRGYTRLSVDARSGAETWLQAEFAGGVPVTVDAALMVKPQAGTTFGSVAQASRDWESGLFVGSTRPFFIDLYSDGSGERVSRDLVGGTEVREPITWAFDGTDILQHRITGITGFMRRWQPLVTRGPVHFVMESEVYDQGGAAYIVPRVNGYIDRGPAVRPAGGEQAAPAFAPAAAGLRSARP